MKKLTKISNKHSLIKEYGFPLFVKDGLVGSRKFVLKDTFFEVGFLASIKAQIGTHYQPDLSILFNRIDINNVDIAVISNIIIEDEDGTLSRIIYNEKTFLAIDNDYIKLFDISKDKIYITDSDNPVSIFNNNSTPDLLFMPRRLNKDDLLKVSNLLINL